MDTTTFTSSSSHLSTPPNTAALHGSFNTGTPPTVNLPLPDCFHLAEEGEDDPVGITPCLEHPGRARRTIFGLKSSTARGHNGTDLFNYENKYPEDDPYKELSADSRFWKACVDEGTKIDTGKVSDWTDALDVLLVFAGLFSAVVSTFICQTFQTLQVDPNEVVSSLVFELLSVQRAIDEHGPGSSKFVPRSDTSFHPSRTATWVNPLWYVSLSLSLATALITALTKQWIHQYMNYAQLGTPRARARVRHFRFTQLQAWHVPAIVGLLPLVMHIALGIFLAGLIIHIRAMSTPMSLMVGGIVLCTLLSYAGTNLLPIRDPSCPYKTPLSEYAYTAFNRLRSLFSWTTDPDRQSSTASLVSMSGTGHAAPQSLVGEEERLVEKAVHSLDAEVAIWMYTISSNPSIRNVVLQMFGDLPLRVVQMTKDCIGVNALEHSLGNAVRSLGTLTPDRQPTFERLVRSIVRFYPQESLLTFNIGPSYQREGSLSRLLDECAPEEAAAFIRAQILAPSAQYDAVVWARIIANAFRSGSDWLEAGLEGSSVWSTFVNYFVEPHTCLFCTKRLGSFSELYTLPACGAPSLTVIENDEADVPPDLPMNLDTAVRNFMAPSLCEIILHIMNPTSEFAPNPLPSDIRLSLALLDEEWILRTSRSDDASQLSSVIQVVASNVGVGYRRGGDGTRHQGVTAATFDALKNLVTNSSRLSLRDQQELLSPFFRCLAVDKDLESAYRSWITDDIAGNVIDLAFTSSVPFSERLPLLSDMLELTVRLECSRLLPALCLRLCNHRWLEVIAPLLFHCSPASLPSKDKRSCTLMVAAFVEMLPVLKDMSLSVYTQVLQYLEMPSNLRITCEVLLVSNVERSRKLWQLVPLIDSTLWHSCLRDLATFSRSRHALYTRDVLSEDYENPSRNGCRLIYISLERVLEKFSSHVQIHAPSCDCYRQLTPEVKHSMAGKRWWCRFADRSAYLAPDGTTIV